ncbi:MULTISPECIES: type 2 lanthipeptide synthetase LanM family protein [unclassified Nostoc]|uniref:type 2 lanthipeptide synthetase LanM family protein n=1 Tax=unclassified Nostoc TaxID=2593658 RepID=UPI002AD2B6FB|nr:type 2 lanthipeptide synthetase LanM family protein [Nostoc sp. DedQUE03]MDZ7975000.1 type 2 lanthipeptide synthetase LanM family protein [Nostoc sp. DedQUE03]MDZ8046635.1 type 2 lanthipeptide synthetase LanM family protein [Nostoc sp. DedQUE02]
MLLAHPLTDILKAIAIKASSLSECLNTLSAHDFSDNDLTEDDPLEIEMRLEFWCQVVAKGDWKKFQQRLEWDGLSNKIVRLLVSKSAHIEPVILPAWIDTLEEVIETVKNFQCEPLGKAQPPLNPERSIAFEDFYIPCLQVAKNRLKDRLKEQFYNYDSILTTKAQTILERKLLESFLHIFAPTLMREFGEFRTSGNALRDFLTISVQGSSKHDKYQTFLHTHLQDGFLSLFEKYSVLGRLVATTIDFWIESTSELLNRLVSDWLAIQQHFSPNQPLNKVVDIALGLSDNHKRGRTVAILTFDTGLKLVYKPKGIGLEVAFGNLLKWCNQHGIDLALKFPEVLNYSTHGWAEYIESLSCNTEDEIRRFYQRSGMLMCLIHALKGKDCHYENLIASGEYPVLIDMETLLHPEIKTSESIQIDPSPQITQKLADSVLSTALLPMKEILVANNFLSIDMSGLGKLEEQTVPSLIWKDINTDGMTMDYEAISFIPKANVPTLNGVPVAPKQFIDEIVTGFEQMYRWLMLHQEQLLSKDSPLIQFADQECRLLFRNTRIYDAILANSCQPDLMEVGIARSVGLDVLSRGFLTTSNKPDFWPILEAEKQDMEQLDIPMLMANTSSLHLNLGNGTIIPDLFEKSSFEQVLFRIQSLDETDLIFQSQVIYLSLCSRFLEEPWPNQSNSPSSPTSISITSPHSVTTAADGITSNVLLDEAINIARILQQQAITISDNSMAWLGMGYKHSSQSFYIQGVGLNLYDGCVGVSLFLAALAQVTGDSEWRDLALKSLHPLRHVLQELTANTNHKFVSQLGIGGGEGLGSLIYGLVRISQLLDEPSLLEETNQVTTLITPELITADPIFDVVGGTAGTILGLLTLFESEENVTHSPILEKAIACGQHLLNHQTGSEDRPRAWKTWRDRQLTGFSQGAAGIAYALLRLFAVTQDSRWLEAATEAIAYEQTMFSTDAQNWMDLRSKPAKFQVNWANGAPGIALARLGSLSVLDTDAIRQEIAIALETTQRSMVWGIDSLNWGNFGRIETLLVAAQTLNCPNLLTAAHKATAVVLENARNQGKFSLFTHGSDSYKVMNPGFFHGLSGIGYEVLRLAYPNKLPSVLLWQ